MTDIWDGIPEAEEFCLRVIHNIDQYKLFPEEKFVNFIAGIVATTGIDAHSESFDRQGLIDAANQINNEHIWADTMHDPTIQPAGRTIAAKVFRSPRNNEYVMAGVIGQYATDDLPTFADAGITEEAISSPNLEVLSRPSGVVRAPVLGFDTNDFDEAIMESALAEAPSSLGLRTERHFRKALDPLSIITLTVSLTAFLKIPFVEELQKEAAKELVKWLKQSLFPRICRQRRTLFEFIAVHNGCRIQFVSAAKEPAILAEATDHFEEGAQSALLLIKKFAEFGFEELIYEYDEKAKKWLPLHAATTKRGVISNRPQLIAMDQLKGFSLGGVAHTVTATKASPQRQKPGVVSAQALLPDSSTARQAAGEKRAKGRTAERRAVKKAENKKRNRK
jgi:hypothetical protein